MEPDPTPEVAVGDIVLYRSKREVVMPAIVTGLTDDPAYLHLTLFPPPGESTDNLDHQWGVPYGINIGCWQPRPGKSDAVAA